MLDQTIPVRDAAGQTVCHQGFLLDITEQKQLEEQLRQSQKMEAVGQLAGGIAHDFNNMLTAISGYAELLAYSFEEGDPRADDVDQVRKAAAHAAALTRQLLAFSRKQVLLTQRLDVNTVLRDLEPMLARTIGAEVKLKTLLENGLALVETDPDQLAQVVLNMALNGRDAMPAGGSLTITTSGVDLDSGPFVSVEVTDTGTGMDEETRGRAFEPFFTTKDTGKGTGLGLATAYGFVSQSGGRIEIDSTLGEGSTVRVLLPAARSASGRGLDDLRCRSLHAREARDDLEDALLRAEGDVLLEPGWPVRPCVQPCQRARVGVREHRCRHRGVRPLAIEQLHDPPGAVGVVQREGALVSRTEDRHVLPALARRPPSPPPG